MREVSVAATALEAFSFSVFSRPTLVKVGFQTDGPSRHLPRRRWHVQVQRTVAPLNFVSFWFFNCYFICLLLLKQVLPMTEKTLISVGKAIEKPTGPKKVRRSNQLWTSAWFALVERGLWPHRLVDTVVQKLLLATASLKCIQENDMTDQDWLWSTFITLPTTRPLHISTVEPFRARSLDSRVSSSALAKQTMQFSFPEL